LIFVTVGTGRFESLVKQIDELKGKGRIKEEVIIQLGKGEFLPKNCKYFRFSPNLNDYYDKANIVISHGGPGTVFEILDLKKKFIAVPNKDRTDPMHQVEYLREMAKTNSFLLCENIDEIGLFIEKVKKVNLKPYEQPDCKIHEVINEFMEKI